MRQASWNLCPQAIQYNTDCYADPDETFNSIAGSSSSPMPDLPDGDWALVLKKDIFQKVRAAAAACVCLRVPQGGVPGYVMCGCWLWDPRSAQMPGIQQVRPARRWLGCAEQPLLQTLGEHK
jgi:hypothetical protein